MENLESSPNTVEELKLALLGRVKKRIEDDQMLMFKDRPDLRAEALRRLTSETFKIVVVQAPLITEPGIPKVSMGIGETEEGKRDGIHFRILSDEEKAIFWDDVAPPDFAVLCEDCAIENIKDYKDLLKNTPAEKLDSDYNGAHTYRSLYKMYLDWALETLAWIKQQSPKDLKEKIMYD